MSAFEDDLPNQGDVLQGVLDRYGGDDPGLAQIVRLAADAPAVAFVGMGSSRSASLAPADRLALLRPTTAYEAGELLHYGLRGIAPGTLVVLTSQSGRSAETLEVARRLRAAGTTRLVTVTNDPVSPLAELADVTLPILAGHEMTVSTRTFVTSFAVLHAIADALGAPEPWLPAARAARLPALLAGLARDLAPAGAAARRFGACRSLVVVGRGPGLAAADYGALIVKETAAFHAEAMAGGSFRHGPFEMSGPGLGLVVLAPDGPTRDLLVRVAADASALGSPAWLLAMREDGAASTEALGTTLVPAVAEPLAPIVLAARLQALAAALATERAREPGVLTRSQKVTDVE